MGTCLNLEHLGESAIVTLQHPPANLLTVEGLNELAAQFEALRSDTAVRAVVLTGAGDKFFSAGVALSQFADGDKVMAERVLDAMLAAFRSIWAFEGVTVAAVNGFALGGGLECALACDYIVVERGAVLGMTQTRVGLIPYAGGARLLADKVGVAWAKRMLLGGELLDAAKAYEIGLVEEVVDPGFSKIVALSLANKVARQGPQAVSAARKLMRDGRDVPFETHLREARASFLALIGSEEQLAGVAAFMDKHQPPWSEDDDDEGDDL